MAENFYTPHGWEGSNYVCGQSTKDISKLIREFVKKEFPECKFSVRTHEYSGGSSIYVTLVESSIDVLNRDNVLVNGYHQLNHHQFEITELLNDFGKSAFQKLNLFVNSYRMSDTDSMIDYFHTNFYIHYQVGDWDKPLKIIAQKKEIVKIEVPTGIEVVDYSERSFAVYGNTKPIKDQLKELGGRFNMYLKATSGFTFAGWIFPTTKKEAVLSALGL